MTAYIQRQGRYFNFDRVYAGIVSIGMLGLGTDQILQVLGWRMFPAQRQGTPGFMTAACRSSGVIARRRLQVAIPTSATRKAESVDGAIT